MLKYGQYPSLYSSISKLILIRFSMDFRTTHLFQQRNPNSFKALYTLLLENGSIDQSQSKRRQFRLTCSIKIKVITVYIHNVIGVNISISSLFLSLWWLYFKKYIFASFYNNSQMHNENTYKHIY